MGFQYGRLDPEKREIRLLEVSPGRPGNKIVARLFTASLDDCPSFEALSYTWGPPHPSYDISINGFKTFPVGRNLRKALDDLRQPDTARILWTDAICINQKDTAEKQHQVRLMRVIYASAQTVCAWLDYNAQPLDVSFDDLPYLGDSITLDSYADQTYWYPVADIFRNPYWNRLWIQQELILAKEVKVHCRRDVFDGAQLLRFQQEVNDLHSRVRDGFGKRSRLAAYVNEYAVGKKGREIMSGGILRARENMLRGRRFYLQHAKLETPSKMTKGRLASCLLQLFLESASLNMTDPRDRVYGVLGLVADVDESEVRVAYGDPVVKVYSQVFSLYLETHKSLDYLCFTDKYPAPGEPTGLPSWMPPSTVNWSTLTASHACGSTGVGDARIDPETLAHAVRGVLVDEISFIGARQLAELPVVEAFSILEGYCRRLWPDNPQEHLHEKDDVTTLLLGWQTEKQYSKLWGYGRPTAQERTEWLRAVRSAAEKADQDNLTLYDIVGTLFTPKNILSGRDWELCRQLTARFSEAVFVGTERGRLGTVQRGAGQEPGDQVWVIHGCRVPLVLRPAEGKEGRFRVVGYVILPGIMHGEALSGEEDGEESAQSALIELE